jgi:hypothetical protein
MRHLPLFVMLFHSSIAWGAATVKEVSFEAGIIYNFRDTYFDNYTLLGGKPSSDSVEDQKEWWSYYTALNVSTVLMDTNLGHLYFDQQIAGQSTQRQFRRVHWEFELGIHIQGVDVFRMHRSEHLLDAKSDNYPVLDIYGLRFCWHGTLCGR